MLIAPCESRLESGFVARSESSPALSSDRVASDIQTVRGQRVLLDSSLAALFGVSTKAFNQAVRRNLARFPPDFLLQLTDVEHASLRSQFVTLKKGRGEHRKYAPLAFTEHGAIMAATVLNSPRAVQMTVYVVRAFVKARELMSSHALLARELDALKQSVAELDADTRRQFEIVHEAILGLIRPGNSRH